MSTTSNTPGQEVTRHDDSDPGAGAIPPGVPSFGREELAAALADVIRSDLFAAVEDLSWLHRNGALGGVHEVIRERRRMIEAGDTAGRDDRLDSGQLMIMASASVARASREVAMGTGGPEAAEEGCRKGGALLAAEIDRLHRMMTPGAQ